jgi:hypothetical protein
MPGNEVAVWPAVAGKPAPMVNTLTKGIDPDEP